MASISRGKKFEDIVKESILKIDRCWIQRLYDVTNSFKGVNYPADFICYNFPHVYLIECKSLQGNRLNFTSHIRENQWDGMLEAALTADVLSYVVCWYVDHDITKAYNIRELDYLKSQGKKSVAWDEDNGIVIPAKKRRTYFDYDFEYLFRES